MSLLNPFLCRRSRSALLPVLACGVCGLVTAPLQAGTLKTADSYGYNTLGGGEFKVTSFTGGSYSPLGPNVPDIRNTPAKFQTFCVEFNEHLQHGVTYYWDLNTGAVAGGPGGGQNLSTWYGGHGTGDPLDPKTAYLYSKFWNGTLSNYDYGPNNAPNANREQDGEDLQRVIWYLEQEANGDVSSGQRLAWYNEAVEATTLGTDNKITWSGLGGVRVLNLYSDTGMTVRVQDQLIVVPAPQTYLAGLALCGAVVAVGKVRRRAMFASRASAIETI